MDDLVVVNEQELTQAETARRRELEQIIQDNFLGFVAVGNALAEIRDSRLYRDTHKTWEHYCRDLWDMSRQRANQLEGAASVVENLSTIVDKKSIKLAPDIMPCNEAQARELARLEPDEQRVVWTELVRRKFDQRGKKGTPKITAMAVKKAVKAYKGEKLEVHINQSSKEARQNKKDFQSEKYIETWEAFLEQVNDERRDNWRHTSREAVFNHLTTLVELVAGAGSRELKTPACSYQESDMEKLFKAGFSICRTNEKGLFIEAWDGSEWISVMDNFSSKREMSEAFEKLMEEDNHLRA